MKENSKIKIKKFRVSVESQNRQFNSEDEARRWAKSLIDCGVWFITLDKVEVEI